MAIYPKKVSVTAAFFSSQLIIEMFEVLKKIYARTREDSLDAYEALDEYVNSCTEIAVNLIKSQKMKQSSKCCSRLRPS